MISQAIRHLINGESRSKLTTLHEDGLKRLCIVSCCREGLIYRLGNLTDTCLQLVQRALQCTKFIPLDSEPNLGAKHMLALKPCLT